LDVAGVAGVAGVAKKVEVMEVMVVVALREGLGCERALFTGDMGGCASLSTGIRHLTRQWCNSSATVRQSAETVRVIFSLARPPLLRSPMLAVWPFASAISSDPLSTTSILRHVELRYQTAAGRNGDSEALRQRAQFVASRWLWIR
jgi:hypothetical protein